MLGIALAHEECHHAATAHVVRLAFEPAATVRAAWVSVYPVNSTALLLGSRIPRCGILREFALFLHHRAEVLAGGIPVHIIRARAVPIDHRVPPSGALRVAYLPRAIVPEVHLVPLDNTRCPLRPTSPVRSPVP